VTARDPQGAARRLVQAGAPAALSAPTQRVRPNGFPSFNPANPDHYVYLVTPSRVRLTDDGDTFGAGEITFRMGPMQGHTRAQSIASGAPADLGGEPIAHASAEGVLPLQATFVDQDLFGTEVVGRFNESLDLDSVAGFPHTHTLRGSSGELRVQITRVRVPQRVPAALLEAAGGDMAELVRRYATHLNACEAIGRRLTALDDDPNEAPNTRRDELVATAEAIGNVPRDSVEYRRLSARYNQIARAFVARWTPYYSLALLPRGG
jgi:hypothetical protein